MDFFSNIIGKLNTSSARKIEIASSPIGTTSSSARDTGTTSSDSSTSTSSSSRLGGSTQTNTSGTTLPSSPSVSRYTDNTLPTTVIVERVQEAPTYGGGYGGWSDSSTQETAEQVVDVEAERRYKTAKFLFWGISSLLILGLLGVFDKKQKVKK